MEHSHLAFIVHPSNRPTTACELPRWQTDWPMVSTKAIDVASTTPHLHPCIKDDLISYLNPQMGQTSQNPCRKSSFPATQLDVREKLAGCDSGSDFYAAAERQWQTWAGRRGGGGWRVIPSLITLAHLK